MDLELLIWVLVFVGGYSAILGYLLWVAMRGVRDPGGGTRDPQVDANARPRPPG
jgi:hypothetical protein